MLRQIRDYVWGVTGAILTLLLAMFGLRWWYERQRRARRLQQAFESLAKARRKNEEARRRRESAIYTDTVRAIEELPRENHLVDHFDELLDGPRRGPTTGEPTRDFSRASSRVRDDDSAG